MIQRPRPSRALEQEVFLTLQRVADRLMRDVELALKPAALSPNQYNILRILRGASPQGASCREVAERMLSRDPDITRLLDRLEVRRLVRRSREGKDRRIITARITPRGVETLKTLDPRMLDVHRAQFTRLGGRRLRALGELLKALGDGGGPGGK